MQYFGDNFVTLGSNMNFSDHGYSSSVAGYSQIGYRSLLKLLELEITWKLPYKALSNIKSKVGNVKVKLKLLIIVRTPGWTYSENINPRSSRNR